MVQSHILKPGMVAYAYNPSAWEAKTGGLLPVQDQPRLPNEFEASQNCIIKACLKMKKKMIKSHPLTQNTWNLY